MADEEMLNGLTLCCNASNDVFHLTYAKTTMLVQPHTGTIQQAYQWLLNRYFLGLGLKIKRGELCDSSVMEKGLISLCCDAQ